MFQWDSCVMYIYLWKSGFSARDVTWTKMFLQWWALLHELSSVLDNRYLLECYSCFLVSWPVFPRNLSRGKIVAVNEVWKCRFFLLHSAKSTCPMEGIIQYILVTALWILEMGWVGRNTGSYLVENGNSDVLKSSWLMSPSENLFRGKNGNCLDWTLK